LGEPSVQAKDRNVIGLGVVITLVSLIGAFALGDYALEVAENAEGGGSWTTVTATIDLEGSAAEGQSESKEVNIEEAKVISVTFTLRWTDEPDADGRHSNTPDTLGIDADSAFGSDGDEGSNGELSLSFVAPEKKPWDMRGKPWNITITAVNCGDQEPLIPDPIGFRTIVDGGNDYQLTVDYVFKAKQ